MAGIYLVRTVTVAALAANTTRTIFQAVVPASHGAKILRWSITFGGVVVTAKEVVVRMLRQTTAGTASASNPTAKDAIVTATPQTTGLDTYTVEPTAGTVIMAKLIHPQSGYEIIAPMGQEHTVGRSSAIDRVGWDVFIASGEAALDVRFEVEIEE